MINTCGAEDEAKPEKINFNFGISFADFYDIEGLKKLDKNFYNFLLQHNKELHTSFTNLRDNNIADKTNEILLKTSYIL